MWYKQVDKEGEWDRPLHLFPDCSWTAAQTCLRLCRIGCIRTVGMKGVLRYHCLWACGVPLVFFVRLTLEPTCSSFQSPQPFNPQFSVKNHKKGSCTKMWGFRLKTIGKWKKKVANHVILKLPHSMQQGATMEQYSGTMLHLQSLRVTGSLEPLLFVVLVLPALNVYKTFTLDSHYPYWPPIFGAVDTLHLDSRSIIPVQS